VGQSWSVLVGRGQSCPGDDRWPASSVVVSRRQSRSIVVSRSQSWSVVVSLAPAMTTGRRLLFRRWRPPTRPSPSPTRLSSPSQALTSDKAGLTQRLETLFRDARRRKYTAMLPFTVLYTTVRLSNTGFRTSLFLSYWPQYILLSTICFYGRPNLSGRRLDVCHTSTHGVALVRI